MIPGSTLPALSASRMGASRVVCGALAANSPSHEQRDNSSADNRTGHSVRRGAERCTRGRARSPNSALAVLFGLIYFVANSRAAEVIPPKPTGYFADYAGVVSKEAALRFNEQLAQFERETSNQVWVVVYPKMQSDSDIADYTRRVAQSWRVGQKGRNNGAVLFVFVQDRKMFIPTGYGVEGALPDATAFDITEYHVKPHFRNKDYEGGLAEGINLICQAIRGEYKGTGKTALETRGEGGSAVPGFVFFLVFIVVLILIARASRRRGYGYSSLGGPFIGGWSGGSGGGWSSGGGGGFSGSLGGGGSFGGGGAGSSW